MANSGPSIFGIKRLDKVLSPSGEILIFLGVKDGEIYLEREDKTKGEPFVVLESSEFSRYTKK
jgi:hypothetical protein